MDSQFYDQVQKNVINDQQHLIDQQAMIIEILIKQINETRKPIIFQNEKPANIF